MGFAELLAIGPDDQVIDLDGVPRRGLWEHMFHQQRFRFIRDQFGPDPGEPQIVIPARHFRIGSRIGTLAPGLISLIVNLGHQ